ncbi:hypothetical protein AVEN_219696-1 [Araneus ventricosus]|uniref:Gustatory receptor n=1 Tax=Araneus ventricosus TaxID=182803 RepID=A0A4Y2M2X3_ARAVE|nr:hypothetical protein AVEN_219696-1 [Araneus ventricosus]
MIIDFNRLLKKLTKCGIKRDKYVVILSLISSTLFQVVWFVAIIYFGFLRKKAEKFYFKMISTNEFLKYLPSYFPEIVEANELAFFTILHITFCLFVTYYLLCCRIIRILLQHLLEQLNGNFSPEDFPKHINLYEEILEILNIFDDRFSLCAFLTVLITMTSIFREAYVLAFSPLLSTDFSVYMVVSVFFHLASQLAFIASASLTNETSCITESRLENLLYKHCNNGLKLPNLKANCLRNSLTLWKMYVVDRSLAITCLGSLLTYGILLGTLGK